MSDNNNNDDRIPDITELPTGEYPALADADPDADGDAPAKPAVNGSAHTSDDKKQESVRAAFWLTHLETEVSRLHAKWQSIDAEFKSS